MSAVAHAAAEDGLTPFSLLFIIGFFAWTLGLWAILRWLNDRNRR